MSDRLYWPEESDASRPMYQNQDDFNTSLDLPHGPQGYAAHDQSTSANPSYPSASGFPFNHFSNPHPDSSSTATNPLARFMQQESAWNPAPLQQSSLFPANGAINAPAFTDMRMPALSESASFVTGPHEADSGYRTKTQTYSVRSAEPNDGNLDCPEAIESFQQLQPYGSNPSRPSTSPNTPATSVHADDQDAGPKKRQEKFACPHCPERLRLKSEMKKHVLKHEKPFCCHIENCPKSKKGEGFTSTNDLDRHKRTKHKIFPPRAKVYVCASRNCDEADRRWPRYDNFKQHVERMHKDEDMELLLTDSEKIMTPDDASLADGTVSVTGFSDLPATSQAQSQASMTYHNDNHSSVQYNSYGPVVNDSSFAQSQISFTGQSTNNMDPTGNSFPHVEGASTASFGVYQPDTPGLFYGGYPSNRLSQASSQPSFDAVMNGTYSQGPVLTSPQSCPSPQDRTWGLLPASRRAPSIVIHQPSSHAQKSEQDISAFQGNERSAAVARQAVSEASSEMKFSAPQSSMQIHRAALRNRSQSLSTSYVAKRRSRARHGPASGSLPDVNFPAPRDDRIQRSSIVPGVQCKTCNKILARYCDMKKHERRHSRPFGCTHDMCHKQFGSKNDWKRHETSQHSQEELWRCDLNVKTSLDNGSRSTKNDPCNRVYTSATNFAAHLRQRHAASADQVEFLCKTKRIGRKHQDTFWCGFCRKICTLAHQRKKAWDERFDHIGDHFLQDDKRISEWLPPQGHQDVGKLQALRSVAQSLQNSPIQELLQPETSSGDDGDAIFVHPDSPDLSTEQIQLDPTTFQEVINPEVSTSTMDRHVNHSGAAGHVRRDKRPSKDILYCLEDKEIETVASHDEDAAEKQHGDRAVMMMTTTLKTTGIMVMKTGAGAPDVESLKILGNVDDTALWKQGP